MKKFGRPFTLIAFTTLLGLAAIWPPDKNIKLGIDLSGGTILVYQAEDATSPEFRIDDLIAALKKRINPQGTSDIVIRAVGRDRVEIILPKATPEEVEDIKRRMTAVGAMQFRILADRRDGEDAPRIERALASDLKDAPTRYRWAKLAEIITRARKDDPNREWVRIDGARFTDPTQAWQPDHYAGAGLTLIDELPDGRSRRVTFPVIGNDATTLIVNPAQAQVVDGGARVDRRFGSIADAVSDPDAYRLVLNPSRTLDDPNLAIRSVTRGPGREELYVLYRVDSYDVTGDMLEAVFPEQDRRLQPAVGFRFKPQGANKFGRLTRDFSPGQRGGDFEYRLAILLDDLVMSAPGIRQEIRESGIIEGMPVKQRDELIEILRAGKLPSSIDPIPLQQENIGPTLGRDTIEKGLRAILVSMCVVPIFMVLYYRFAGVVAVIALVLNVILLVGSMALTKSSFTLPGLAGLALTIGMAVDANVLIFERMREEAARGANLGTQIRNGFGRAWTAILDSNITTVLTGLVLWAIGTEEIKGFAITLIIGLAWNLFTAVYVSRVIFEFCYQKGILKELNFMSVLGHTDINFVGPRRICITASIILILLGLASFASQGGRNFNIDFTGGTLVTLQLNDKDPKIAGMSEAQRLAFVRQEASNAVLPDGSKLPDVTVESLSVTGEKTASRFNVRTTYSDQAADSGSTARRNAAQEVQEAILKSFGDALSRLTVQVSEPAPIPKADAGGTGEFAGGTSYTLTFNRDVDPERVRLNLTNLMREARIANPESRFSVARVPRVDPTDTTARLVLQTNLEPEQARRTLDALSTALPNDPSLTFERFESFGASVAGDTRLLAILAVVSSWLVIIAYLWFRFKSVRFGMAAVLALVHDVLIALGVIAFSPYKIDLPMIAAFLTIIGFSVNDTIVIFDRIREIKGKSPHLTEAVVNAALNQTLSRTLLTSFTALLVVGIMYFFGGEGLRGFSFCLLVGFISGIYSTIYIASPVLIDWMGRKEGISSGAKTAAAAAR